MSDTPGGSSNDSYDSNASNKTEPASPIYSNPGYENYKFPIRTINSGTPGVIGNVTLFPPLQYPYSPQSLEIVKKNTGTPVVSPVGSNVTSNKEGFEGGKKSRKKKRKKMKRKTRSKRRRRSLKHQRGTSS